MQSLTCFYLNVFFLEISFLFNIKGIFVFSENTDFVGGFVFVKAIKRCKTYKGVTILYQHYLHCFLLVLHK